MEWNNELVLEFLDIYEKEPVLWNLSHNLKRNRVVCNAAWKRIQEQLSRPVTVPELKTKKGNLMCSFKACLQSVKAAAEAGADYKPNWFAYAKMASFLRERDQPRTAIKTEDTDSLTAFDTTVNAEDADSQVDTEDELPKSAEIEDLSPLAPKKKKIVGEGDEFERKMDEAYTILQNSVQNAKIKKDECDIFGDLVAAKLRKMDEETRDIAMNKINNLLFDMKRNMSSQNAPTDSYTAPSALPLSPSTNSQQSPPSFHQVFLPSSIK